jgi:CheY-like chemotaxis protein
MALTHRKFLVLDLNTEGLQLLSRTLSRKFAGSTVVTASLMEQATELAQREAFDAIVVHRPIGMNGSEAVRTLRGLCPHIPIVWVSGSDHSQAAMAAGASCFLLYDEWLMVGGVVDDLLQNNPSLSANPNLGNCGD